MTFARLVLAATLNDPVPPSVDLNLPPRQVANSLIQYFLTNIYTLYPCFSETALWTILDDVYNQDDRVIKDSDYWLMYIILAIGSTAQSKALHDSYYQNGVQFLARALKHADRALAPGNVTQIRSLLLLTLYSMLDPAHFDTWHLIGFTARAVVDLGLHQDPPMSTVSDRSALDMRRRIFYSAYALDRYDNKINYLSDCFLLLTNYIYHRAISMVHARTFSFTDDSISVAFPNARSDSHKPSDAGPITGPQSSDPAILLFQLRRAQSYWYQELYQSDSTPLPDSSSFLWQMCLDMREWGESLPETLPAGIRRMFDQELRYSYVYCIAPSVRAPQITDYTRSLIFEYALDYLNVMHDIAHTDLNSALYTYHDALKVYFMGNQFLAVLRDAQEVLLSGRPIAAPPVRPGCPPPPPIPRRHVQPTQSMGEMIQKSLNCLERIPQTLSKYGERWEDAIMLMRSFQQLSTEMLDRLRSRQTMGSPGVSQTMQQQQIPQQLSPQQLSHQQLSQQQLSPQQLSQQQMQYQNNMQAAAQQQPWVGVNVAQMMHGGPPQ